MSLFDRLMRVAPSHKAESLFDRAIGANAAMIPGADGKGYAEPMKNDLPGNMNPRDAGAAKGTRWQNKRIALGPERAIKSQNTVKTVGAPEQAKPSGAGRPGQGPQFKAYPKSPTNLPDYKPGTRGSPY